MRFFRRRAVAAMVAAGLAMAMATTGCDGNAQDTMKEVTFHVNSYRVPCVGMGPMSCLQVKRGEEATGDWQNFYTPIHGFDYQPGYLYRIRVRETALPPEQVPADASSIRYDLVEVVERSRDTRFDIHDIWALRKPETSEAGDSRPYIEFNVTEQRYLGDTGCASFTGDILEVGPRELALSPADVEEPRAGDCAQGGASTDWSDALARTAGWRREGLTLTLTDSGGKDILVLRKVD